MHDFLKEEIIMLELFMTAFTVHEVDAIIHSERSSIVHYEHILIESINYIYHI